jgi:NAD(P)H-flavin reductase
MHHGHISGTAWISRGVRRGGRWGRAGKTEKALTTIFYIDQEHLPSAGQSLSKTIRFTQLSQYSLHWVGSYYLHKPSPNHQALCRQPSSSPSTSPSFTTLGTPGTMDFADIPPRRRAHSVDRHQLMRYAAPAILRPAQAAVLPRPAPPPHRLPPSTPTSRAQTMPLDPFAQSVTAGPVSALACSDASSAYSVTLPGSSSHSANSSSTTLPTNVVPSWPLPAKSKSRNGSVDIEKALPQLPTDATAGPTPTTPFFLLRSAVFNTYRRLFTLVTMGNLAAFILVMLRDRKTSDMLNITAANLLVTGLIRNPLVINRMYAILGSVPRSAPLRVRVWAARVFQFGGIHSGCAIAAFLWYAGFLGMYTCEIVTGGGIAISDVWPSAILGIGYTIVVLLLAVIVAAHPNIRRKYHNTFERTHRLGSWSCTALFWALLFAATAQDAATSKQPLGRVLVQTPAFWFIIVITLALIQPWLHLRRVRVEPEKLSNHVTRLHFSYTTPSFTQGISAARHPLKDWHSFATVSDKFDSPNTKFSVVVSRAGDFTGDLIDHPPCYLWKRSIPVHGFGNSMTMFSRVLMVATGSGIGPLVGFLGDENRGAMRVVWQTRDPLQTYGQRIIDLVHKMDPDALILDSTKMGKRVDMVPLVLREFATFHAEAVCIITNEKMTKKLVFECEARGVPAFGPVFDS